MDDNFRKAIEREARLLNSLKHIALPAFRIISRRMTVNFGNGIYSREDLFCILETQGEAV
ncbi:MAG: hypothetical protein IPI76_13260 [Chloracidobacterium sp.]|nr:hypothetical protein [Chloracidobacterium sp.]